MRKRNLARFMALLMATAMIVAVLLMVAMPFADAPPGAMYTAAIPLLLIVAAFEVICAWALSKDVSPMASNARGAPLVGDARMDDQVNMKDQRRHWARRYPTGFLSCRMTHKRNANGPVFTKIDPHMKLSTDVPLLAESAVSACRRGLAMLLGVSPGISQQRSWMKRRFHDSVFGTFAYGVAV